MYYMHLYNALLGKVRLVAPPKTSHVLAPDSGFRMFQSEFFLGGELSGARVPFVGELKIGAVTFACFHWNNLRGIEASRVNRVGDNLRRKEVAGWRPLPSLP